MLLNASLDSLVQNLHSKNDFKGSFLYLIEAMGEKKAKLLSRKGVYCYDYYCYLFPSLKKKSFLLQMLLIIHLPVKMFLLRITTMGK